jgi:hypothetical protein
MLVNSDQVVASLYPKLGTSVPAIKQYLGKAGRAGALVTTALVPPNRLLNVYDLDELIDYFDARMKEKGLNKRISNKTMALLQAYKQYLEEMKYDICRRT